MDTNKSILGINLEGFQTFEDETYIPLGQLTFMFGPNSSGKSAIQDALELYEKLHRAWPAQETQGGHRSVPSHIRPLLKRHWRKEPTNGNDYVASMSIAVRHYFNWRELHDNLADASNRPHLLDKSNSEEVYAFPSEITVRWIFRKESEGHYPEHFQFSVFCGEHFLFEVGANYLRINIASPLFRSLGLDDEKALYEGLLNIVPGKFLSVEEGVLTIVKRMENFHPKGIPAGKTNFLGESEKDNDWLRWTRPVTLDGFKSGSVTGMEWDTLSDLVVTIGRFLGLIDKATSVETVIVDASRVVPTTDDLSHHHPFGSYGPTALAGEDSRVQLHSLARSLAAEVEMVIAPEKDRDEMAAYGIAVNDALARHLFVDQGYQLAITFEYLMGRENSFRTLAKKPLDTSLLGFNCEIVLQDSAGRVLLFEDVGSGIGYVLPVLAAACCPLKGLTVFNQQPELHLHPALQAELGDLFIEAGITGSQQLIETHSEHLLLRILRRIREHGAAESRAQEMKISSDDVCVLYFHPQGDGTTKVKRLRISKHGEFMDRWPNGFFNERDREMGVSL